MFSFLTGGIKRFMFGRNGPDMLTYAILALALILRVIFGLFNWTYPMLIPFIPLGFAVYRMLSRKLEARRLENEAFMNLWNPSAGWFKGRLVRLRDSKTHKYFLCPDCKSTVRVPRGKGKVIITCPLCGERFERKS